MSTSPSSQSGDLRGIAPPDAMNNQVQIGPGAVAKLRNPILVVIYTIITLGIYQIYWWYSANRGLADYGRARGVGELGDDPGEVDVGSLPGGADRRTCDLDDRHHLQAHSGGATSQRTNTYQRLARLRARPRFLPGAGRLHAERPELCMERGSTGPEHWLTGHGWRRYDHSPFIVGRMADRRLPSRLVGRRASNLVGTIEGAIVATALVAGLDEADTVSPARALWLLFATGTFFWLAHAYADLLAGRIQGHYRMNREDIVRVVARERHLFQAALPLAVPLVLGAVGLLSDGQALNLAWLVGVRRWSAGASFSHAERATGTRASWELRA